MSLGCAIIGGILFGPAGFVAGALVNNQKEKIVYVPVKKDETSTKVFGTNYVPMEDFMANIDYFYDNRKTIDFYAISCDKEDALAKGKEALEDKLNGTIVKEIYVPGRIVNIVQK